MRESSVTKSITILYLKNLAVSIKNKFSSFTKHAKRYIVKDNILLNKEVEYE